MSSHYHLRDQALELPVGERAALARELILSLEEEQYDPDAEQNWETEIERRLSAVDRGEVSLLEWRDSVKRIRGTLNTGKSE